MKAAEEFYGQSSKPQSLSNQLALKPWLLQPSGCLRSALHQEGINQSLDRMRGGL